MGWFFFFFYPFGQRCFSLPIIISALLLKGARSFGKNFPVAFPTMSNRKRFWMPLHIHMERAPVWLMVCFRWRQVYIIMVRRKSNWIAHARWRRCCAALVWRRDGENFLLSPQPLFHISIPPPPPTHHLPFLVKERNSMETGTRFVRLKGVYPLPYVHTMPT